MRYLVLILSTASVLLGQIPMMDFASGQEVAVQNCILTTVNENIISVLDVKKKLDVLFHQNYPNLANSTQARYQFYEKSWRPVLMELIDQELILADAASKEIKLSDGEVREEMEMRFGPSVLATLDHIGITYDEAWKLIKNELIVRRMSWWFVQSKAIQNVTPSAIRTAYQAYKKAHPSYTDFKYQVIVIKNQMEPEKIKQIEELFLSSNQSPDALREECQKIDPSIQISTEYAVKDLDISAVHLQALSSLEPKSYSRVIEGKNRGEKNPVFRIFYLNEKEHHPTESFEAMTPSLKNELIQKSIAKESYLYLEKLRKQNGFDEKHLTQNLPDNFQPFSIH
jgi:hypothetical protein